MTDKEWAPKVIYLQREAGEGGTHTWADHEAGEYEQAEYIRTTAGMTYWEREALKMRAERDEARARAADPATLADVRWGEVERLKAENAALRAELDEGAMIQALNDIWKAVDGGLGDWEYPGQIVRAVWKAADTPPF